MHGTGETGSVSTASGAGVSQTVITRDAYGHARKTTVTVPGQPVRVTTTAVNKLGWTLESVTGTTATRTMYDRAGRIETIASGGKVSGNFVPRTVTTPSYTSAGMIASIDRSEGSVTETTTMTYDSAGRLASSTSAGLTTSYHYDSAGRVKTRTESCSGGGGAMTTQYDYDACGRLASTTTPGGKTTTYAYDGLGRQAGRTGPDGLTEALTLDVDGSVLERKLLDDQSRVWSWESYTYDSVGRRTGRTVHRYPATAAPDLGADELLMEQTTYYADGADRGLVHTMTDALGRQTSFTYDDAGREVERTLPDGTTVATAYTADGKVESRIVTGPSGWTETTSYTYDDHGRVATVTDPSGWSETTSYTYDEQGRVASVTDPSGRTTSYFYDELGRKVAELVDGSEIDPGTGQELPVTRLATVSYGELGRTVTETRPDGATITRTYDERGNLVAYIDHEGNATTYDYDCFGRLVGITYPDDSGKAFTYTADGELATITRADGTQVAFAHDAPGRLESVTVDGQPEASYSYDPAGHLLTASNPAAGLAFTWDSTGNQLGESLELLDPAFAGLGSKELSRTYDMAGRVATLTYPDGLGQLARGHDAGDRLISLALDGVPLWQAAYDGGRLRRIDRANGLATTFDYTPDGYPTTVATGVPAGDTITDPIHRLDLGWTADHLRRTRQRRDTEALLYAYHYDQVGHLESLPGEPRWPAVRRDRPDLALPALPAPTAMTEDWQVNQVDELTRRTRIEEGRHEPVEYVHNPLHQVLERTGTAPASYTWDVNGNLQSRTGGLYGDAVFTHDWRDRLVRVEQGSTTTDILLDPLGRMVGKVKHTPDGDVARAYLHDGDQVAIEYVERPGGGWRVERRHLWGRWIDDLVVEQVDTDGDGSLETTLYSITDLLGSVQLLTDDSGTIVERITYDPDGTPHFWSADTVRPSVTRVAWTGDGTLPTGDTVPANAFEIGLSEPIDPASAANATAILTADGGDPVELTLSLVDDGRIAYLSGATIAAGTIYTLHLEGLTDTSHNPLWPEDATVTIADANTYELLDDTTAPTLLAVLDGADALYLLFDEPVEPAAGYDMTTAIGITRSGQPVEGAATRLSSRLLAWQPTGAAGGLVPGGSYTLAALHLADLAGNAATATATFTHLSTSDDLLLLAYQAPTDTQPEAASTYGLTTLFQGRTWHADLGMYDYRARWYLPEAGVFGERDPFGYAGSPNQYMVLGGDPLGAIDPMGLFQDWVLTKQYKVEGGQATPRDSQNVPEVNIDYLAPWLSKAAQKALSGLFKKDVGPDAGRHLGGIVTEANGLGRAGFKG